MTEKKKSEKVIQGLRYSCLTLALIFTLLLITACMPTGKGTSTMYPIYGLELTSTLSLHTFRIGSFAICAKNKEGMISCSPTGTMKAQGLLLSVCKLQSGAPDQSCLPGLESALALKNKIFYGAPAASFVIILLTLFFNLKFKGNRPATSWVLGLCALFVSLADAYATYLSVWAMEYATKPYMEQKAPYEIQTGVTWQALAWGVCGLCLTQQICHTVLVHQTKLGSKK